MKLFYLLFFVCFVFFMPSGEAYSQNMVRGKITDNLNHKPLSGVSVILVKDENKSFFKRKKLFQKIRDKRSNKKRKRISNRAGYFKFKHLKSGKYTLLISKKGYADMMKPFNIEGDDTIKIDFRMKQFKLDYHQQIQKLKKNKRFAGWLPKRIHVLNNQEVMLNPRSSSVGLLGSVVNVLPFQESQFFSPNTTVFVGGIADHSKTLVLLDGVPVNKLTDGTINWKLIPYQKNQAVYTMKNPTVFYGGDAAHAVIDFTQETPTKKISGGATAWGGMHNLMGASANLSGSLLKEGDGVLWSADGFFQQAEGYKPPAFKNDTNMLGLSLREINGNGKLAYVFENKQIVEASFTYYDAIFGDGFQIRDAAGGYEQQINQFAHLKYSGSSDNSSFEIKTFYQTELTDNQIERVNNSENIYQLFRREKQTTDYGVLSNFKVILQQHNLFSAGFDYRHGEINFFEAHSTASDSVSYSSQLDNFSAFANNRYRFYKSPFSVSIGLRFEYVSYGETDFFVHSLSGESGFSEENASKYAPQNVFGLSPTLAFQLDFRHYHAHLSFAKAFHAPNSSDLYQHRKTNDAFLRANPDLAPEKIYTYELSNNLHFADRLYISASVYYSLYTDYQLLMKTNNVVNTQLKKLPVYQKQNIKQVDVLGAEFEMKARLAYRLFFKMNYSLNYSQIKRIEQREYAALLNKKLAYMPDHKAYMGLIWSSKYISMGVHARALAPFWYEQFHSENKQFYVLLDARLSIKILKGLSLSADGFNLLNAQYYIDNKEVMGIYGYGTLSYQF